ncbi:MAG: hypothetical protein HUU57_15400 [Bdellovibrio sp.]|nr:hypothetical protein [Bdellovibrio sp.]
MIPDKNDPRWREVLLNPVDVPINNFATKMLLTRARTLAKTEPVDVKLQEAIDIAFAFFTKNQFLVADDIQSLFGPVTEAT